MQKPRPQLRDRERRVISTRHDSIRPEEASLQWTKRFVTCPKTCWTSIPFARQTARKRLQTYVAISNFGDRQITNATSFRVLCSWFSGAFAIYP